MTRQDVMTGTVGSINRKGHTIYGNPIIEITIHGDNLPTWKFFRISDNAQLVYEIENPEYRERPHTFALTRAGRISHVVR